MRPGCPSRPAAALGVLVAIGACGEHGVGTTRRGPSAQGPGEWEAGARSWPGDDVDASTEADAAPDGVSPPPSCAGKTGARGDRVLSLTSGGYARTSLLHVPASYDPTRGAMLVVNYHGFGSDALQEVLLSGMNPIADAKGFVVAYPYGLGNGWNAGDCCTEAQPPNVDDVKFTQDLLALVEAEYCVDPKRVYATGMSNGGFMSHRLACAMADTFAAVAPVAGVLGIPPETCKPSRPVPVMHFHGTDDPVVPYDGGPALKLLPPIPFRSVDDTILFWRGQDACLGAPTTSYAKGDATCARWAGCQGTADVTLCTIAGGGHTWPGGLPVPTLGKTSTDLDASSAMIQFFLAHPMP